jgi:hypothetical protein
MVSLELRPSNRQIRFIGLNESFPVVQSARSDYLANRTRSDERFSFDAAHSAARNDRYPQTLQRQCRSLTSAVP